MSRHRSKPYVVSQIEKHLRQTAVAVLAAYESEYVFHTQHGHFNERMIRHQNDRYNGDKVWENLDYERTAGIAGDSVTRLRVSIGLTLYGCYCKADNLSIPCKIRQEIEDGIVNGFLNESND